MADTIRTSTALFALLANNTDGDISAQDLRDMLQSLRDGHGEMYVSSAASMTPDDTATYKDLAGTFTLVSGAHNWDMNTNGQLRYTGTPDRHATIQVAISMTSGSNNQILHFRVAKNGTSLPPTEIIRKVGTGAAIGAAALNGDSTFSTNDYFTVQVRNASSTGTVKADKMHIIVHDGID